ncbi:L,D-transpeptidase [Primorskyibacter sp. S187A]|uniref:L,D-transpeptidase n=1 Tax=Primorskyibacter sp. S187A TaxID=3415130 RepID=UPI003C797E5D
MNSRRTFLASAAATLATPAFAFKLDPILEPQYVAMDPAVAAQQILVLPRARFLYFIDQPGRALRYGVGVGQAGLDFQGEAIIQVKKEWPTWRPTNEMIERDPRAYAKFVDNDYVQPGGPGNPLGARALYLFQNGRDTYYRIHGTTAPRSIGQAASNGCIRMLNDHVVDLYDRVPRGTKVTVL